MEILLHVGIDTVGLRGAPFEVLVEVGQRVAARDALLNFDADFLADHATSLITPILVVGASEAAVVRRSVDRVVRVGDPLFEIVQPSAAPLRSAAGGPAEGAETRRFRLTLKHGIHARPAARIAACAAGFQAYVSIATPERSANARSVAALLALATSQDDCLTLSAEGPDARQAADTLMTLILSGIEETGPESPKVSKRLPAARRPPIAGTAHIVGLTAAPGLAVGTVVQWTPPDRRFIEHAEDPVAERVKLTVARDTVRCALAATSADAPEPVREIATAHIALIDDPELIAAAEVLISAGSSAAYAWLTAARQWATLLRSSEEEFTAARSDDLEDIGWRVASALSGPSEALALETIRETILLADEMLPSQLLLLADSSIAGVCLARGGPTSHLAIIARALGIPAIAAAGEGVMAVPAGSVVVLDADNGVMEVAPDTARVDDVRHSIEQRDARRSAAMSAAAEPCQTLDGTRITVMANIDSARGAAEALASGAEGCGLLRTEFVFEGRRAPKEDEQQRIYQAVADGFGSMPVIFRTFDAGSDKPLPYLPMGPEDNPALGIRGIRLALRFPDLLRAQYRALLRTTVPAPCRIMLPMVSDLEELRAARAILDDAQRSLGLDQRPALGIMVETPAAALMSESLAREADFISVGTNDLAQYTLAADRCSAVLGDRQDAIHPAVLRLIRITAEGARLHDREISVCGGLACDLDAIPILLGFGISSLSMPPAAIPDTKAYIRQLDIAICKQMSAHALTLESAAAVREYVRTEVRRITDEI